MTIKVKSNMTSFFNACEKHTSAIVNASVDTWYNLGSITMFKVAEKTDSYVNFIVRMSGIVDYEVFYSIETGYYVRNVHPVNERDIIEFIG